MTTIQVTAADRTGITTTAGHMTWATATAAAIQADAGLAAAYRDILRAAHEVCTDPAYSQAALDTCAEADRDARRPKESEADRQARERRETEHDRQAFRSELLDLHSGEMPGRYLPDDATEEQAERYYAEVDRRIAGVKSELDRLR
jgi:hypothetical protein